MKKTGAKEMNNIIEEKIYEAISAIKSGNNIFIASHVNPDGDNMGSMLSLALALKKIGKNVVVLKSDVIPEDYRFLPGIQLIQEYRTELGPIDVFIALDSSDEERLGDNGHLLKEARCVINIDHHISSTRFGDINVVDDRAAATGELVYYLIKYMKIDLDVDIGTNLYTAISTDTGKFSYESVTSDTHRIVAELIDTGIDFNQINIQLYENMSIEKTRLFIHVLSTLKTYENSSIATAKVTQTMLKESGAKMEDTEGIVSFIRKIASVEVACILKEVKEDDIKISLRSKKRVDVASICEFFGGGGHIRAAGCSISSNIDDAENMIVSKIREYIR